MLGWYMVAVDVKFERDVLDDEISVSEERGDDHTQGSSCLGAEFDHIDKVDIFHQSMLSSGASRTFHE